MEIMQVLHMNKGEGETSYAKNSTVQRKIISITNPIVEEALVDHILPNNNIPESMGIADLGCSSGPNSLIVLISNILDIIYLKSSKMGCSLPEIGVFLNDLPGNDFNNIFESLPAFYSKLKEDKSDGFECCFISGVAGSFFGRLFPSNSLHFVHSSSSLHWLSQVPHALDSKEDIHINKGKIYISKTSTPCVLEAYLLQFQKDFWLFLRSRSQELVPGERMVLTFLGRTSTDPTIEQSCCYQWELLAQALMSMVLEGLVQEEKIDSFNVPFYAPHPKEIKFVVTKEGSFTMDRLEAFEIDWDEGSDWTDCVIDEDDQTPFKTLSSRQKVANTYRAVAESMLESHFGGHIMDDLFRRYSEIVEDHLSKNKPSTLIWSFPSQKRVN